MMNLKSKLLALFACAIAMTSFIACTEEGDDEGQEVLSPFTKTVMLSRETEYGNDWIYFSLREGKELENVTEENHMDDMSWDLAFNRYNIRTNSGKSGNGKGGAMDSGSKRMDKVTTVPSGDFIVDENDSITGSFTGSGITQVASTLNKKLGEAIKFQGPPPSYTPNNHVYIIRTADGSFAKIKVLGFYDNKGEAGYMSFHYQMIDEETQTFK